MSSNDSIVRLADALDPVLGASAFKRERRREWMREWGWKQDRVDLHILLRGVLINLYVLVPIHGSTDEYDTLAVEGLGHVIGRERPDLPFGLLGVTRRFARNLGSALGRGLAWYERFDTRAKCLQYVKSGGVAAGTISYSSVEATLVNLSSELDRPACLIAKRHHAI